MLEDVNKQVEEFKHKSIFSEAKYKALEETLIKERFLKLDLMEKLHILEEENELK